MLVTSATETIFPLCVAGLVQIRSTSNSTSCCLRSQLSSSSLSGVSLFEPDGGNSGELPHPLIFLSASVINVATSDHFNASSIVSFECSSRFDIELPG